MVKRLQLEAGHKFERLSYISEAGRRGNRRLCLWFCDCGTTKEIPLINVTTGKTTSCGCAHKEGVVKRGPPLQSHKMTGTRTYNSWRSMLSRCTNTNHKSYYAYGNVGIQVCDEWKTFQNFVNDMGIRPEGKSLDRINTYGNYEPGNCKWSTPKEQANNRKNSKRLTAYIAKGVSNED